VKPIGATESKKVDLRIIATTNKTLIEEVESGSFREDLFYRLAVAVLQSYWNRLFDSKSGKKKLAGQCGTGQKDPFDFRQQQQRCVKNKNPHFRMAFGAEKKMVHLTELY